MKHFFNRLIADWLKSRLSFHTFDREGKLVINITFNNTIIYKKLIIPCKVAEHAVHLKKRITLNQR